MYCTELFYLSVLKIMLEGRRQIFVIYNLLKYGLGIRSGYDRTVTLPHRFVYNYQCKVLGTVCREKSYK